MARQTRNIRPSNPPEPGASVDLAVLSIPADIGTLDTAVIRCIAAEISEDLLDAIAHGAGVDVRQRMDALMSRHLNLSRAALRHLDYAARRRLAEYILDAELELRETMPGDLAPLRRLLPD
jgi:hypothetical protein